MAKAFEAAQGSLSDRLMATLVAADHAVGDHRGRLAAALLIADPSHPDAPFDLRADDDRDAVTALQRLYLSPRNAVTAHAASLPLASHRLLTLVPFSDTSVPCLGAAVPEKDTSGPASMVVSCAPIEQASPVAAARATAPNESSAVRRGATVRRCAMASVPQPTEPVAL